MVNNLNGKINAQIHAESCIRRRQSLHARVFWFEWSTLRAKNIPQPAENRTRPYHGILPRTRPNTSLSARLLLLQVQVLRHSGTRQAKQQYRMEQYEYPAVSSPSISFTRIHSCPSLLLAIDKRRNGVRQGRSTRLLCDTKVPPSSPLPFLNSHGPYDHCRTRPTTSLTSQTR